MHPAFRGNPVGEAGEPRDIGQTLSMSGQSWADSDSSEGLPMHPLPRPTVRQTIPTAGPPGRRAMDLVLAGVMSVLALPLLLAAALAVRILDGRPVFHRSLRIGRGGAPFTLWKLRTLRPESSGQDGASGGHIMSRRTRTGPFLRRTRIDELPQLWNVLRGEMAMVGVRPPLPAHVAIQPAAYAELLQAPPGLTGLATLYLHGAEGHRLANARTADETEAIYARCILPRKLRLDRIHARRRTVVFDLWILSRTLAAVGRLALAGPADARQVPTNPPRWPAASADRTKAPVGMAPASLQLSLRPAARPAPAGVAPGPSGPIVTSLPPPAISARGGSRAAAGL